MQADNRIVLDVLLAELRLLSDEIHARMRRGDRLIALGAALITVAFGTVTLHVQWLIKMDYFFAVLFIPIPFYFLALLQLREDVIRLSLEKYFYRLRERIIKTMDQGNVDVLGVMAHTSEFKRGRYSLLSAVRYAFPATACVASIVMFSVLQANRAGVWGWYGHVLFWGNIGAIAVVFGGGFGLSRVHLAELNAVLKQR